MAGENELGEYVTLPVILSFEGVDKQVNKSLAGAFKGIGRQGGQQIGQELAQGVKASEAEVKRALDNHQKLADKAADATGKLTVAQTAYQELIDKGVQSGARYERAKAAAEKAARDETRAIRQATAALKDYEAAAKSAEDAGSQAGGGFLSGLRGSMSGAASSGSDAAASFAEGFAGSSALLRLGSAGGPIGLAIAAGGLIGGGLLAKNIAAGIAREPARDLIQAQLGLDEDSMGRLGAAAGQAYADNFGSSQDEVWEAARRAVQGGLIDPSASAAQMEPIIEQLTAINQLVEGDLTTTTKAASVLMRNGLAADADAAFDIIAAGYERMGDLGDDLIDSISEYGSGWKNSGFSAQQALALIKQSVDMGVDNTDRGADALREFGRRVTEEGDTMTTVLDNLGLNGAATMDAFKQGGDTAFQAFDQVFDTIRAIEDPVRRNKAAMQLLGDTAGDFIGTFAQWDPSKAAADFGTVEGAAQSAADTMGDNVAGSFESARRNIEVSVQGVQDKLDDAFGPALQDVADLVTDNTDSIAGAFIDMASGTTKAIGMTLNSFGEIVGGVGNVYGAITKLHSGLQRLTGDEEYANELLADAENAFGWGEGLKEAGNQLVESSREMDRWSDGLGQAAEATDEAKDSTDGLKDSIDGLPGEKKVGLAVNLTDGQGRPITPDQLTGWFSSGATSGVPAGSPLADLLGPYANRPSGAAGVAGSSALAGLNPGVGTDWDAIAQAESSGRWDDNNSGGHTTSSGAPRGGLQITDGTWAAFGGKEFAPTANLATKQQQIAVAERIAFTGHNGTAPQGLGAWEVVTKGMVPGITANSAPIPAASTNSTGPWQAMNQYSMPAGTDIDYGATGFPQWVYDLASAFNLQASTYGGHQEDRGGGNQGIDFSGAVEDMQRLAEYLASIRGTPGLEDVIWMNPNTQQAIGVNQGRLVGTPGSEDPMYFRRGKNDFLGHQDHVHLTTGAPVPVPGSTYAAAAGPTLPISPGTPMPGLTSGFGPDYEPGIGQPGYNEYGDPGYYQQDPRAIASADRRVEDTERAILDADKAIADAKTRRAELEEDLTATAEQRAQADRDITDAEQRARRAREDAEWAQEDANEARLGRFTAAKEAKKDPKSSQGSELGELGSIASSFLRETFGIDLSDNTLMQMLGTGLNAFGGLLGDPDAPGGGGTSGAAFGLPNVAVPPVPGGAHPGSGAVPGSQQNVTIDSRQIVNGNVGWDPVEIERQRTQNAARAIPRIPVGN